jgi:hypothetical protein
MTPLAYLAGGYIVFDVLPILAVGAVVLFFFVLFCEIVRGTWGG